MTCCQLIAHSIYGALADRSEPKGVRERHLMEGISRENETSTADVPSLWACRGGRFRNNFTLLQVEGSGCSIL